MKAESKTRSERLGFWERLFRPRAVAVFGAHPTKPTTFANMFLAANIRSGYEGKLYPVGIRGGEVFGRKIHKSLAEVPDPIDLACVAVPADHVLEVLEECCKRNIPGAQILTAGFSELGTEEGRRAEARIAEYGKRGMRIIGPNCFGIYDPGCGLTLMPGGGFTRTPGPVAFISQSGGQATDMGYAAPGFGFGWRRIVSVGNACDVGPAELVELFAEDPECSIISLYLEGVRDGRAFLRAVGKACLKKPVVVWKVGLTEGGSRAVSSHTGSMGGSGRIWESALRQAGATLVHSQEELLDAIHAFHNIGQWTGDGIGFVGGGGAMSAAAADAVERHGFKLPKLASSTVEANRSVIAAVGTSPDNPVDAGSPVVPPHVLGPLMDNTASDPSVEAVLLMQYVHHITYITKLFLGDPDIPLEQLSWHREMAGGCKMVREARGKPVAQVLPPLVSDPDKMEAERVLRLWRAASHSMGVPTFSSLDRALTALGHVRDYRRWREKGEG